jgi:hypothetical protein
MWSSSESSWLQSQMSRVRFPALHFLSSCRSGTRSIRFVRVTEELIERESSLYSLPRERAYWAVAGQLQGDTHIHWLMGGIFGMHR